MLPSYTVVTLCQLPSFSSQHGESRSISSIAAERVAPLFRASIESITSRSARDPESTRAGPLTGTSVQEDPSYAGSPTGGSDEVSVSKVPRFARLDLCPARGHLILVHLRELVFGKEPSLEGFDFLCIESVRFTLE